MPLGLTVVRERRKWQAVPVEGITVFHHVGVAKLQRCEGVDMQCGPVRRLALGRRRV